MQEIKTIWQDVSSQDRCKFADVLLNDHLSDGWTILNIATSGTHDDGGIYRAVMLVREATEAAPAETPFSFKVHNRVRVLHSEIEDDKEFVGKVGRITSIDARFDEIYVDFDGVEAMMISSQLELADTIPF